MNKEKSKKYTQTLTVKMEIEGTEFKRDRYTMTVLDGDTEIGKITQTGGPETHVHNARPSASEVFISDCVERMWHKIEREMSPQPYGGGGPFGGPNDPMGDLGGSTPPVIN